jgi:molybdopterin-binding protein
MPVINARFIKAYRTTASFRGSSRHYSIMAHITVQVGENHIESVITRRSAEELQLKQGDTVTVVIKSTEVMLSKP